MKDDALAIADLDDMSIQTQTARNLLASPRDDAASFSGILRQLLKGFQFAGVDPPCGDSNIVLASPSRQMACDYQDFRDRAPEGPPKDALSSALDGLKQAIDAPAARFTEVMNLAADKKG